MVLLESQARLAETIAEQRLQLRRQEREWTPNSAAGRAMPFGALRDAHCPSQPSKRLRACARP